MDRSAGARDGFRCTIHLCESNRKGGIERPPFSRKRRDANPESSHEWMVIRESRRSRRASALRSEFGGLAESTAEAVALRDTGFPHDFAKSSHQGISYSHRGRARPEGNAPVARDVEAALEFSIRVVERYW